MQTVAFALKYMFKNNLLSKILVQIFCFVYIVLHGSNVSTTLFIFILCHSCYRFLSQGLAW